MSTNLPNEEEKLRFMTRAIELSNEGPSRGHGGPYGAVVVKEGHIIGEGYNHETIDCDPTGHGEMTAIRNACQNIKPCDLSGCDIYSSCEPCALCTSAIWCSRIACVFYGTTIDDTKDIIDLAQLFRDVATPIDQRSSPGEQIKSKSEEARDIITKWANDPNLINEHLIAKLKEMQKAK